MAKDAGNPLKDRRSDAHRLDGLAERALTMNERIERGTREKAAENLKAFFASAHSGEPVVHKRDAKPSQYRRHLCACVADVKRGAPACSRGATHVSVPLGGTHNFAAGIHAGLLKMLDRRVRACAVWP
jgi:hypothetical protein